MSTHALPAGPRRTPWGLWQIIKDPDTWVKNTLHRYGDPFTERTVGDATVFTTSPEGARQLFTADPDLFEVPNAEQLMPLLGEHSVIFLVGAQHRAERKLLNPHFHGGRMRAYGKLMREITRRHISTWRVSDAFRAIDSMQSISLDVIIRAVFGVDSDRLEDFRRVIMDFVHAFTPPLVFIKKLRRPLFGLGPWDAFVDKRARFDAMIDAEVARRRAPDCNLSERHDILSLLMQARYEDGSAMTGAQLRQELLTLLFAGHETTGAALSWMLYRLHKNPSVLERLRSEIAALGKEPEVDTLTQMPYLTAVCKETLRLHPLAPIVPPRQLREPWTFMGYSLPKKTLVSVATMRLHKREDLYPEPLKWNPERFLNRTFTAFEYLPFGGGPRRCIGSEFALYEMKIVLATILSDCRLSLASDQEVPEERRGLLMGPKGGVPMLLTSRMK